MISLEQITKTYGSGEAATHVLHPLDLRIGQGEFVAIMGPSGSGKSTLLNILGALDVPSGGRYRFEGTDLGRLTHEQRALFRRYVLGFVFQGFNLLKRTSALENVEMPLIYQGVSARERRERAEEALVQVGLAERMHHDPSQLSGGQQQRVAIARAIVTQPQVLIADEPTGNLDTQRSHEIMELIRGFNAQGITVIMVTHEEEIAEYASRTILLRDGRIEQDTGHAA
ncbi:ABC transporter ATP-binding protein [Sulfurimonas sp. HSL-3221]|uniref:ABC transporter ATP-binding protein n=1 Tax=Sulfurimonadaceae TaxID=2771471 RepID=UPI001E4C66AD|nr:ABC transporter ATP-binding protein [Sulfurimonas sp. HSL-3221]UFS62820.1 ABC transporter ATP-binding protein [Sulfurimonas sp. HSL-3221]